MAELSRDEVAHVALLARLGLDEAELEAFRRQLNHIVEQYAILTDLDTAAIPPTAQVIELENVLREDVPESGLTIDQALAGAPERIGDHLVVPAILGERG